MHFKTDSCKLLHASTFGWSCRLYIIYSKLSLVFFCMFRQFLPSTLQFYGQCPFLLFFLAIEVWRTCNVFIVLSVSITTLAEEESEKHKKRDVASQWLRLWATEPKTGSSNSPSCHFWALEQGLSYSASLKITLLKKIKIKKKERRICQINKMKESPAQEELAGIWGGDFVYTDLNQYRCVFYSFGCCLLPKKHLPVTHTYRCSWPKAWYIQLMK